jgi:hypothetical protein
MSISVVILNSAGTPSQVEMVPVASAFSAFRGQRRQISLSSAKL